MNSVARKGMYQLASSGMMGVLQIAQIGALARVFDSQALGVVALYSMVIAITTVFCDFGLQSYVIQDTRPDDETAKDVAAVLPLFMGVGVAACAIAYFISHVLVGSADMSAAMLWITPAVPLALFMGPLQGFAVRRMYLERLALAEAIGKGAGVAVAVGLAYFVHMEGCVMVGFYVALLAKVVVLHHDIRPLVRRMFTREREAARVYATVSYAVAQLLGQIANLMAAKADEMIVAATMPLAVYGIYGSLKQLVIQAGAFVAPMLRRTTMPLFADLRRGASGVFWTVGQLLGWTNAVYIGFFLAIALNADLVTYVLYGPRFVAHADWLAWFALLYAWRTFAGGGISAMLQSTGAPFVDLTWSAIQAVIQTVVLYVAAPFGVETMMIAASVAYAVLGVIGHLWIVGGRGKVPKREIVMTLLLPVVGYFAFALVLALVEQHLAITWLQPVWAVVLTLAIAALTARVTGFPRTFVGVKLT
jgi:O-antigen/teichoic acid export membrane protein